MNLIPLSINGLIYDAVSSTTPLAAAKRLTLSVLGGCGEQTILADADWLMQVLINLIANAIKFSAEGTGPILVEANCQTTTCQVSVTDHGMGIDPMYHDLIFEKFYQTRYTDSRAAGAGKSIGSGLGLAISKRIVELHGGHLLVSSQPGIGSTFSFQLPLLNAT